MRFLKLEIYCASSSSIDAEFYYKNREALNADIERLQIAYEGTYRHFYHYGKIEAKIVFPYPDSNKGEMQFFKDGKRCGTNLEILYLTIRECEIRGA